MIVVSLAFLGGALVSDTENVSWALALLAASYPVYYGLNAAGLVGKK